MKIKEAVFVISNSEFSKCPKDGKAEYAFIGRSNVGKSSLINMLTDNKKLAKTSGRPGKTQLINHFLINDDWYIVDLPGYGYARTSKTSKKAFQKLIVLISYSMCTYDIVDPFLILWINRYIKKLSRFHLIPQ